MNTYLIIGLGNTGLEYKNTRHNVGFLFVEFLRDKYNRAAVFRHEPKFRADVSTIQNTSGTKLILSKPTTMMNLSGNSAQAMLQFFKLDPTKSLILVHDDLDLGLGEYKIQKSKGPKVHNGINSVEKSIGTKDFWRIRIGIESRTQEERKHISGRDFVLSNFKREDLAKLDDGVFGSIANELNKRVFDE